MEVIPRYSRESLVLLSFLHVCGGDPRNGASTLSTSLVFSTYVEVILYVSRMIFANDSFLHVCGGDPKRARDREEKIVFSPRMWR